MKDTHSNCSRFLSHRTLSRASSDFRACPRSFHRPNLSHFLSRGVISFALGSLSVTLSFLPLRAAEDIYLDYKIFGRVIPVSSLEDFVEDGVIDSELQPYSHLISPETEDQIRKFMGEPLQDASSQSDQQLFSPFVISQWLYSPIGKRGLDILGTLIQTGARLNGEQALRAALILAAADSNGLTLIDALNYFPTQGIRLDLNRILELQRDINAEAEATKQVVAEIKRLSEVNAANEPDIDYKDLSNLSESGPYSVEKQSLILQDPSRRGLWGEAERTFPADLYLPSNLDEVPGPIPVMVISHGYADTRTRFAPFAQGLASNGFAVALPEHIGSNSAYRDAMEAGLTNESFQSVAFVNRPLDISFLLDELEQKNTVELHGRLQLDQVGLAGHSLGGYTALAVAGATIDLTSVVQRCDPEKLPNLLSTAYFIECRLLELSNSPDIMDQLIDGSLHDHRVQLVMALSPVSNLFGESGLNNIEIPVMLLGGAYDVAAPLVPEQIDAFTWLTTPEKFLYLAENTSHTPKLTRIIAKLLHPGIEVEASLDNEILWYQSIIQTLMIAFGRVYLLDQEEYHPYLTSAYVEAVSQEPLKLHLVRSLLDNVEP